MMRKLLADERGSLLPIMAAVIVVLVALAAVAVDYTRYSVASEKLKTASDSAAVAGSLSATRYVKLLINPGNRWDCCPSLFGCDPCCKPCGPPFEITGKEKDLVDDGGWKKYLCDCGGGGMTIIDRWAVYEGNNAQSATQLFFNANIPKEMSFGQGGSSGISGIEVYGARSDPRYPSVVVRATGRVKTLFMDFLNKLAPGVNFSYLNASNCSQGGTYYYDINGKWHRTAQDACN